MRLRCAMIVCALSLSTVSLAQQRGGPTTAPAGIPSLTNTSVSIPWNELRTLLDRPGDAKPPVQYVLANASAVATIVDRTATIIVRCDVATLDDGWAIVPLVPTTAGLIKATLDNQPASLVIRDNQIQLITSGKGNKTLELTIERPVQTEAGQSRVEISLPPAPVVGLTATVPQVNLDVRAPAASALKMAEKAGGTSITATYRGGDSATLIWKQRPAAGVQVARLYSDSQTRLTVDRTILRSETSIDLQIERAATSEVKILVDPASVVLSVTGQEVARWEELTNRDGKSAVVTFATPAEGSRKLTIVTEREIPAAGGDISVTLPRVEGAKRDRGVAAVQAAGGFDIHPANGTAQRISVAELPAALRPEKSDLRAAYSYNESASTIALRLDPIKPLPARIAADTQTRVAVDRGTLRMRSTFKLSILNSGVEALRVALPDGVDLLSIEAPTLGTQQTITENKARTLLIGLKDLAKGDYAFSINYERRLKEGEATAPIPLPRLLDAVEEQGSVGIEVRAGYEVVPTVEGAQRIDVKELPGGIWDAARSAIQFGYRYQGPGPKMSLAITRHQDLDVLVAMSDYCEATTTYTEDGKAITKMMFVVRNNLKPFMTLKMPADAQLWSAFVDDKPVTPEKNKDGNVLIPLKKSEAVDKDDRESYRARREERRSQDRSQEKHAYNRLEKAREIEEERDADLKPYDVEIVFVTPAAKLEAKGQLVVGLPSADVPVGQLSWAVLLPKSLKLVDTTGNMTEVERFTLPFPHFADAGLKMQLELAKNQQMQAMQDAQKALEKQIDMVREAMAAGPRPVRVEIPIVGNIHRFEKMLLVNEAPQLTLTYNRKG